MADQLPDPLVPAEVDLRDFAFMPLDVQRLRDSDLASEEKPEACWAAVLLWCASWHQVPAASIPDSDQWQAKHAGYLSQGRVAPGWKKIRSGALRGWVLCSDGRLYHPVVAEKALDAWRSKLMQRWKTECGRIKKHNQRHSMSLPLPEFDAWLSDGCPQGQPLPVPEDKADLSQGQGGAVPRETHSKRQGQGQGQGLKKEEQARTSAPIPARASGDDPETVGHTPTPAGAVCKALRAAGIASTNPSHPTLGTLLTAGATVDEFVDAAASAQGKRDPFAYVLQVVAGRRSDAKQLAGQLHRGALPQRLTPGQQAAADRIAAAVPGLAATPAAPAANTPLPEVFDVSARRLG